MVECPNLPITPYPPVQQASSLGTVPPTVPCQTISPPNMCPTTCVQNPPVMVTPINQCQTPCGQATPVNPCQNSPCPTIPTNPCPSVCCQNQPVYPCQTVCGQTQPANPCQNSPCPEKPCPTATVAPPPPPQTITVAPPPPPQTTPPPTITFPPPNLTLCPPGTILIGDTCHIIYCPLGTVMKNDRCVFIECPDGTIWTGHRCSVPEPIVHNFSFNHTITTYVNQTTPDVTINNTKNIVVNAPVTINEHAADNVNCNNNYEDCDQEDATTAPTTETVQSCCEVMTPRICEERNNRWHCYSRRSRRCGDFCIAPIIYLKPPRIYASPKHVIMPPIQRECESYGTCGSRTSNTD